MAQLFRVTKLNDSTQSQTFTFILPPATCQENPPEILSRDFLYAGHKWRLSLLKKDKHLSPYIHLTSLVDGMRCSVDLGFVLINRESFTQNEMFTDKQKEFSIGELSHGRRTFVTLEDLDKRRFSDSKGEYLLEVNFKNPKTIFEQTFAMTQKNETRNNSRRTDDVAVDYQHYDTRPFLFGDLEWVCVFCPNMDKLENGSYRHMIQITRKGRSDTLCKLTYRLVLGGDGSGKCFKTETREEIFDFNGNGKGIYFTDDYLRYVNSSNQMKLLLELSSLTFVNHIKLNVTNVINGDKPPVAQFVDKDRQNWCMAINPKFVETDYLILSLFYPDIPKIPRSYLRYVSWSMQVLPQSKSSKSLPTHVLAASTALGTPFECYYANLEQDKGFAMRTKLKMQELKISGNPWIDEKDNRLTIEIEWLCSYLLLHPTYHPYDDIYRKHIAQMRREVQALQAENNSLEKELHGYHVSIANKVGPPASHSSPTPPRTWSIDSANMTNSVGRLNVDDGRHASSSNHVNSISMIESQRLETPTLPVRSQSGTVSSKLDDDPNDTKRSRTLPRNFSGEAIEYDYSSSPPLRDSPNFLRKQLPQSPRLINNHVGQGFQSPRKNFIERKTSNPLQASTSANEIMHRHRLTRRISERLRTRSDRDLEAFGNEHLVLSTSNSDERSKSVSPYPYEENIYENAHMDSYDRFDPNMMVVNDRSKRRREKAGASFKARNEMWTNRNDVG